MDSILLFIKKLLGISDEDTNFDADIIGHINSALSVANQLGVGPVSGFYITDETSKWTEFIPPDPRLEFIKTYIYRKVRLWFDPPLSTALLEALKNSVTEDEFRMTILPDGISAPLEPEVT